MDPKVSDDVTLLTELAVANGTLYKANEKGKTGLT